MKKNSMSVYFISIIISYIIVKIAYKLSGFKYDFSEGIINVRYLIHIIIWGIIYAIVYFLLKKLLPNKTS
jgi:hypothetical protein